MSGLEPVVGLLFRAIGALWVVGGVFLLRQLWVNRDLDQAMRMLEKALGESSEDDHGRARWMAVGGVLTVLTGAAMLLALKLSVALLAALILHQMLYFIRQRRRELAARNAADAEEAQPSIQTRNAFIFSLGVAVLAAWLLYRGQLG
jgi:hypothetical protein